jgi:mevalonate pyrophosphate decarboxylase
MATYQKNLWFNSSPSVHGPSVISLVTDLPREAEMIPVSVKWIQRLARYGSASGGAMASLWGPFTLGDSGPAAAAAFSFRNATLESSTNNRVNSSRTVVGRSPESAEAAHGAKRTSKHMLQPNVVIY